MVATPDTWSSGFGAPLGTWDRRRIKVGGFRMPGSLRRALGDLLRLRSIRHDSGSPTVSDDAGHRLDRRHQTGSRHCPFAIRASRFCTRLLGQRLPRGMSLPQTVNSAMIEARLE